MRSHIVDKEVPRRGHIKPAHGGGEEVNVGHGLGRLDGAGWPLAGHGHSSFSSSLRFEAAPSQGSRRVEETPNGAEAFLEQKSSGPVERSFDLLEHEVDELIQRLPQFGFLKPCRQLEKHYYAIRNRTAGQPAATTLPVEIATSFRHNGNKFEAMEATSKDEKEVVQEPISQIGAEPRRGSRRELEDAKPVQCKLRESDTRAGNTSRELLSSPSEEVRGETSVQYHHHVSVRKQHHLVESNGRSCSTSSDPASVASIPFKWEEEPGKPKSIAAAAQRAMARKLSRDGIELNSFVEGEGKLRSLTKKDHEVGQASPRLTSTDVGKYGPRRSVSERFYARGDVAMNSVEQSRSRGISSARYTIQEKEAHIDLVAPAAAKFLVETFESPSYTPARANASPPAVAIPFKWEDAPGKAKADTAATKPTNTLQLPPRLAVASHRSSSESFSRELKASVSSHPLAGFFSPCITPSSPVRQQQDPTWAHYRANRSLPPKQQPPPNHGFCGHCSSCQEKLSKSGDRCLNQRKQSKSFSQPLTSTEPLNIKPRRLFSSELKSSHPWMEQALPSSPSSILHGPDPSHSQSSSSRTYFQSCELDASTPRTSAPASGSKSSSSASYESVGDDFEHDESASLWYNKSRSFDSQNCAGFPESPYTNLGPPAMLHRTGHNRRRSRGPSESVKALLKLCKSHHGSCLGKPKSRPRLRPLYSSEVWAPTLATYFQRLDEDGDPVISSTGLLEKQGSAPTSSGYLNSRGEPLSINDFTNSSRSAPSCDREDLTSPDISPDRPTRLPYKMPSVAEQELAARGGRNNNNHTNNNCTSGSSRSLMASSTPAAARLDKYWISTARSSRREDQLCPSPAYTAALELLSPAVNLMSKRHKAGSAARSRSPASSTTSWSGPKPHQRVQFILSICKTLKRVLFRQQARRSVIGTKLMYHDERAPTTFQFSKPN